MDPPAVFNSPCKSPPIRPRFGVFFHICRGTTGLPCRNVIKKKTFDVWVRSANENGRGRKFTAVGDRGVCFMVALDQLTHEGENGNAAGDATEHHSRSSRRGSPQRTPTRTCLQRLPSLRGLFSDLRSGRQSASEHGTRSSRCRGPSAPLHGNADGANFARQRTPPHPATATCGSPLLPRIADAKGDRRASPGHSAGGSRCALPSPPFSRTLVQGTRS